MGRMFGYIRSKLTDGLSAKSAVTDSHPIPENMSGTDKQSLKVPHLNHCPECGNRLAPVAAKGLCHNPRCPLYKAVVENCCGD